MYNKFMSKRFLTFLLSFLTFLTIFGFTQPHSTKAACAQINPANGSCGLPGGVGTSCSTIPSSPNPFMCCTPATAATECLSVAPPPGSITGETGTTTMCNILKALDFNRIIGLPSTAQALFTKDKSWYDQTLCQFNTKVFDHNNPSEIFGERYTAAQVNWITNSLTIFLINTVSSIASFGFVSSETSPFAGWYPQHQVSFVSWLSNGLKKFDIATPVAAQGYGFETLSTGIQTYWTASRNTAYLIMVVLLVAAGFAVMFRVKINPQTAVSIQLMIPRIVLSLIFVTFSFAIAGLVIDLIYVIIGFVVFALQTQGVVTDTTIVLGRLTKSDILPMIGFFLDTLPFTAIVGGIFIPLVGAILVPVVVLILIFRVIFMLFSNYVTLIFQVIIAPWQIMLGILPTQAGFTSWLRSFVATASVFIVVPLMFLAVYILWSIPVSNLDPLYPLVSQISRLTTGVVGLPLGSTPGLPLMGLQGLGLLGDILFRLLMGFAILALMPKVANMIKDALKVPPFKYGTAFGEALGPGKAIFGGYVAPELGGRMLDRLDPTGRLSGPARRAAQGMYDYAASRKIVQPARVTTDNTTGQKLPNK